MQLNCQCDGVFRCATGHSHVIHSDEHGASWHVGGVAQTGTNESSVVETAAAALILNCRNHVGARPRVCVGP